MYEIKFIKNPPTLENLKSLCESEIYQNILKEFAEISKHKLDDREQDNMRLITLLNYNVRRYMILNIPYSEVLYEFEIHKNDILRYWLASADFFIDEEEDVDGEFPEGEELGEDDKSVVLETFGINKTAILDIFCEFYLLKTGDKERLLHYFKTTRMPDAKKYAGQITKLFKKNIAVENPQYAAPRPETIIEYENDTAKNWQTNRKIAFVNTDNENGIKKVMICKTQKGFYLFEFDTKLDCNNISELFYENLEDAEFHCIKKYDIKNEDWLSISNQEDFCNLDYIMPVKIKGRENRKPEFDNWEIFQNGKWQEFTPPYNENINAMTGNERLYRSGLLDEYEKALKTNKEKAKKILIGLEYDDNSVKQILSLSDKSAPVSCAPRPETAKNAILAEFQEQLSGFSEEKRGKINAVLRLVAENATNNK
ncbi:MAG: hypothetical protein LBG92_09675 [Prevotellaceae bacterium]|jgi:biofilm protein TabA|nr:hypothetical protein [Prevotellaceae bacterium]